MPVYGELETSQGGTVRSVSAAEPGHTADYSPIALPKGGSVTARSILQLQRTVGNRAVQRLMASRQPASQSSVDRDVEGSINQASGAQVQRKCAGCEEEEKGGKKI